MAIVFGVGHYEMDIRRENEMGSACLPACYAHFARVSFREDQHSDAKAVYTHWLRAPRPKSQHVCATSARGPLRIS